MVQEHVEHEAREAQEHVEHEARRSEEHVGHEASRTREHIEREAHEAREYVRHESRETRETSCTKARRAHNLADSLCSPLNSCNCLQEPLSLKCCNIIDIIRKTVKNEQRLYPPGYSY